MSDQIAMKIPTLQATSQSPNPIFSHFPGAILEFDVELRCVAYENEAMLNFTGQRPDFLLGRTLEDLIIPSELKAQFLEVFNKVLHSKSAGNFYTDADESRGMPGVHTFVFPVSRENELHLLAASTTTIERESVDWRTFFSQVTDVVTVLDESGNILYQNRSYLGMPADEVVGKKLEDFFEDDEKLLLKASLHRVFEDGTALTFDNYVSAFATPRWFSNSLSLFTVQNGIRAAIMISREISGSKNKLWELAESNKIYDSVIEGVSEAVVVISPTGRVMLQNDAAKNILGSEIYSAQGLEDTWVKMCSREKFEGACPLLNIDSALRGTKLEDQSCLLMREDQSLIHVEFSLSPMYGEVNDLVGAMLIMRETTENHFASQQLIKANQNLDSFVHATAHDLKSPINNMKNLFALMDRLDSEEKRAILLDKVRKSVDQLDDFLAALMEMVDSRNVDESRVELLNLLEVFSYVKSNLSEQIGESGGMIHADFSEILEVRYIKAQLISIFQNMISNAIKYRDENKVLEIEIKTYGKGDFIVLEIADNGIGIDLEKHGQEIFKPFKRLSSKAGGKGIGLNLVKNFVERNGGTIDVVSKVGEGTKFMVHLKPYDPVN